MDNIEWFTPLLGGIVIGIASSLLLLIQGKIFGVSGILSGSFLNKGDDQYEKIAIVLGLITGSFVVYLISPHFFDYSIDTGYLKMVIAGLLVGFGTRYGSGCTSGHGMCGIPRFSIRSLVAVMTFMFTGIVSVLIMNLLNAG